MPFIAFLSQSFDSNESLLLTRQAKLEQEKYKKKLQSKVVSKKELSQIQADSRKESLAKPIDKSNKGFMLLQKMMSKTRPEEADKQEVVDLVKKRPPIPVELKSDRKGLGHRPAQSAARSEPYDANALLERRFDASESQFRANKRAKTERYFVGKDLHKCQKVCFNLDQQTKGKEATPTKPWYWPKTTQANDDQESGIVEVTAEEQIEEEEEIDELERLCELTNYLRSVYQYCPWCSIQFTSPDDLTTNCPGATRAHHEDI